MKNFLCCFSSIRNFILQNISDSKSVIFSFLLGCEATMVQVLLFRELLASFTGNELTIGLFMAVWLLSSATGAYISNRFESLLKEPEKIYGVILISVSCFLPFLLAFVKSFRLLLGLSPFEAVSPLTVLVVMVFTLFLPSFMLGALYVPLVEMFRKAAGNAGAAAYSLEALGSAAGGAFMTLVFAPYFNPFTFSFFNAAFIFLLFSYLVDSFFVYRLIAITAFIFFLPAGFIFGPWIDFYLSKRVFMPFETTGFYRSKYGTIQVISTGDETSIYENGALSFTAPEITGAEELAHFAMSQAPDRKNILMIGGGFSGALGELLKYPVSRIDYLELDPALVKVASSHVPAELMKDFKDRRVRVHSMDARRFAGMKARAAHDKKEKNNGERDEKYHLVLMNQPQPVTACLGRLYTEEFMRELASIMTEDGVFIFTLPAGENYMGRDYLSLNGSILNAMKKVFSRVLVTAGEKAYFIGERSGDMITLNPETLAGRFERAGVKTKYFSSKYFISLIEPGRIEKFRKELDGISLVNSDNRPVAFYYALSLWFSYFYSRHVLFFRKLADWMHAVTGVKIFQILLITAVLCGLYMKGGSSRKKYLLNTCVAGFLGFGLIGAEMLMLFYFQTRAGYIYEAMGLLVGVFMLGLFLGSWKGAGKDDGADCSVKSWMTLMLLSLLYYLFPVISKRIEPVLTGTSFAASGIPVLVLLILFFTGCLGGFSYSRLLAENKEIPAGKFYAADLVGSSTGAIASGVFMLPLSGFESSFYFLSLLTFFASIISFSGVHLRAQ